MSQERRLSLAKLVSEVLGPVPMGVVLAVTVGIHSGRGILAGVAWGLLSVTCAAVLPAIATASVRRYEARTLRTRLLYMTPALIGAIAGLGALSAVDAPREIRFLAAGLVVGLSTSLLVNTVYPSSNHVAALAGGAVLAGCLLSPYALGLGIAASALMGWARHRLKAHSLGQVVAGAIVGFGSVGILVFLSP